MRIKAKNSIRAGGEFVLAAVNQGGLVDFILKQGADWRFFSASSGHVPGAHKITMNVVGFLKS